MDNGAHVPGRVDGGGTSGGDAVSIWALDEKPNPEKSNREIDKLKEVADKQRIKEVTPEIHAVVKSNGDFAFDLYSRLSQGDLGGNLFFSPYSVSSRAGDGRRGGAGGNGRGDGQSPTLRGRRASQRRRRANAALGYGSNTQCVGWR